MYRSRLQFESAKCMSIVFANNGEKDWTSRESQGAFNSFYIRISLFLAIEFHFGLGGVMEKRHSNVVEQQHKSAPALYRGRRSGQIRFCAAQRHTEFAWKFAIELLVNPEPALCSLYPPHYSNGQTTFEPIELRFLLYSAENSCSDVSSDINNKCHSANIRRFKINY